MNSKPLLSVIVPIYNVAPYVKECIESIMRQFYKNLQIILVDDGSKDASGDICEEYAAKDSRIQVIHKENGGLVTARKAGLALAEGEYIGFVDGDDWIDAEMYESFVNNILQTGADFIYSGLIRERPTGSFIETVSHNQVVDFPRNDLHIWKRVLGVSDDDYLNRGLVTKLFKRELIYDCYNKVPDDCCVGEDYITTVMCLLECRRVSFLAAAYYHYRMARPASYSHSRGLVKSFQIARLYKQLVEIFEAYSMCDIVGRFLEQAFIIAMITSLNQISAKERIPVYQYPDVRELFGKRIILYGTGEVGLDYHAQLSKMDSIQIVDWVDRKERFIESANREIHSMENILVQHFDKVLLAVKFKNVAEDIMRDLRTMGVSRDKIIWKPIKKYVEF